MKKEKVEKFLEEVEKVCRKHNMSISHEDGHGAFIIEKFDEFNISWLRAASIAEYKELDALLDYVNSVDIEPDNVDTSALLEENKRLKNRIKVLEDQLNTPDRLLNDVKWFQVGVIADWFKALDLSENEDISEEDKKELIYYIDSLSDTLYKGGHPLETRSARYEFKIPDNKEE